MEKIGIFYGSTMGNTRRIVDIIAKKLGKDNCEILDISECTAESMNKFVNLIFATSTWGLGKLQTDWEQFIPELKKVDMQEKIVAIVALGDQECYSQTFVNSMGILHDHLNKMSANIIGTCSTEGYFSIPKNSAVKDNRFVGLALDEINQPEMSDQRIDNWLQVITKEFK